MSKIKESRDYVAKIEGKIEAALSASARGDSKISPEQTQNVIDHMLRAEAYLLGTSSPSATPVLEIFEGARLVLCLDKTVGTHLNELGKTILGEAPSGIVKRFLSKYNLQPSSAPENEMIYRMLQEANFDRGVFTDWLLNTKAHS